MLFILTILIAIAHLVRACAYASACSRRGQHGQSWGEDDDADDGEDDNNDDDDDACSNDPRSARCNFSYRDSITRVREPIAVHSTQ